MDSTTTIGIDLGTTYSCVGVFQHGKVEIIANDYGNRTTPSCVAFTDTERMVGEVARSQATRNPENTVFEVKRLMGRTFDDPKVQEDIKSWPFKVRSDNGKPKVVVEFKSEMKKFTAEEISAMILTKMKSTAEAYLGTEVKNAVITVPAYFNDSQRQATKDAAKIAGLCVKRIINEPTAAALAYGLDKKLSGEQNVLVFDLGGGTFDVSILTTDGSMFEVLATSGDTHLGGEDFDNRMVNYLASEFKRKYKKDPTNSPKAMRKLKMACEQAKRALSSCSEAAVEIDSFYEGIYFFSKVTRAKFEELCNDLFKKTIQPVEMALRDANLKKSEIHEVVLVGGSTRIPKVQKMLEDFFDRQSISKSINPDEAVAYGAAVQAAILSEDSDNTFNDVVLIDVTPLSLGTDVGAHSMCTIIERNTRIPAVKSHSFSPGRDYQTAVHVGVYQGERALVKDNHTLGEFTFTGLRAARVGEVSVLVEFSVDEDGILTVSAKEQQTGKTMTKTISNDSGRLTQREIERMLEEAQAFQEEDDARRLAIAALHDMEQYVCSAGRSVEESGHVLADEERQTAMRLIGEAQQWLDTNTLAEKDETECRFLELRDQMEPILRKTCQTSSGEPHSSPDAPREEPPNEKRDGSKDSRRDRSRHGSRDAGRHGSRHAGQHGSRHGSPDEPRDARREEPRSSRKNESRSSRKNEPRDSGKDEQRDSQKNEPRGSRKDESRGSRKDESRGSRKDESRGSRKNEPRDSQRNEPRDSRKNRPRRDSPGRSTSPGSAVSKGGGSEHPNHSRRDDDKEQNGQYKDGKIDEPLRGLLGGRKAPRAASQGLRAGLRGQWSISPDNPEGRSQQNETEKTAAPVTEDVD